MLRYTVILAAGIAALTMTAPAGAASFNCAKAKTPSEKTICAKPTLNILDQRMGAKYKVLIGILGAGSAQASSIRAEQVWWLGQRDGCGKDANCLRSAIGNRIKELDAYTATATAAG
jgi:uncharacterized protein